MATRYADKPKTVKTVFRKCGLPPSTGYALVMIGRRVRDWSATDRERLRRVGASKARLIARAHDAPLDQLFDLADRLPARDLARRLSADAARASPPKAIVTGKEIKR